MIPIDVVVEGKGMFITFLVIGVLFLAAGIFYFREKLKEIEPDDKQGREMREPEQNDSRNNYS